MKNFLRLTYLSISSKWLLVGTLILAAILRLWQLGSISLTPSAIFGILSVYLTYLICVKLFNKRIGIFVAFVSATNPWLIYFSRGSWEVNVSLTLTLMGIYFFLLSRERVKYIIPSLITFALTLVIYPGAGFSTAIVILILAVIFWRDVIKYNKKYLFGGLIIGLIISISIIWSYHLFFSETLNFTGGILDRYFNLFSAKFLFFEGDYRNLQNSAPYQGMLLLSDLFLLIIGMIVLVRQGAKKETLFIWLWLLLSPLPAVFSHDQVQSVKALNMVIPLMVISGMGLAVTVNKIRNLGKLKILGFFLLFLIYLSAFIYFADAYFIHTINYL